MATAPVTTGAPTRASIIPYPDTLVRQARRELNRCHSQSMLDRWLPRAMKYRRLSEDERIVIGRHAVARQFAIATEGC